VCLTGSEIESGITPGHEYHVFGTRFGKVGMMICYDGFFPELARELSIRGAEVIAWPVMGCDPLLARARACKIISIWLVHILILIQSGLYQVSLDMPEIFLPKLRSGVL